MQYRQFGRTNWQVSEICFGAWQLGGTWGAVDKAESIATLHCAFEQGINLVDTAAAYGAGQSETLVGQAVKQWRSSENSQEILVATKVPPLGIYAGTKYQDSIVGRYPKEYIIEQVDASLQRLQLECIDLLQLHLWFSDGTEQLEWLDVLTSLVKAGKIREIGVSLADIKPETGVKLAQTDLVCSQQVIYNIFEQAPNVELFRQGEQTNTAFIARVPFDSGALTGTWTKETYSTWSVNDKRHQMYQGDRFSETLLRVEKLKELCASYGYSLPEAAMRFCLADKAVSTVACGMRNPEEVKLNTAYSDGKAANAELNEKIKKHHWTHKFY
jgi:aryl-alcohol dehydrogenase-like predicted oxidoreductase